ncbi:MAG: hypothetical protein AAGC64_09305 [Bacteroidota bacterium]
MEIDLEKKERELNNYKNRFKSVSSEVENYISNQYAPNFTEGILSNQTNVSEMKKYAENDAEFRSLKKFILWVVNETYKRTDRKEKLN